MMYMTGRRKRDYRYPSSKSSGADDDGEYGKVAASKKEFLELSNSTTLLGCCLPMPLRRVAQIKLGLIAAVRATHGMARRLLLRASLEISVLKDAAQPRLRRAALAGNFRSFLVRKANFTFSTLVIKELFRI
jgi:uncharacterized membrane protein YhhN